MKNLSAKQVRITGGFWKKKQELLGNVTAQAIYDRFEETGRFAALWGKYEEGMPRPHIFWDSDVAKWIEGAAYLLMQYPDAAKGTLVAKCDDLIARVCAAQAEDGYLNSYYQPMEPEKRFTDRGWHELYCLGHWIEAAVAYDEATGKKALLGMCEKYVALVDRVFRVENAAAFETPGHEELELALYRLYLHTGKAEYMRLMRHFIDRRGAADEKGSDRSPYFQSHMPVRQQTTCEGHSVRAMYLYCAMADQAAEDGDEALKKACLALYRNCTRRRMYVTGGIGSSHIGEAFTVDYDLDNRAAYTETCASLGLALFCRRMLKLGVRGDYMDTAELALFNGALSGLSLSGDAFFYENPLDFSMDLYRESKRVPQVRCTIGERVKVFACSCCPPNVLRVYGSLQEFLYGVEGNTLYVHMMAFSEAETPMGLLRQETRYPNEGGTAIYPPEGAYTLAVRIPRWAENAEVRINGKEIGAEKKDGYVYLDADWKAGDRVDVKFDLGVRFVHANPKVESDAGKVCLMRGPIVYCLEGADNGNELYDCEADTAARPRVVEDGNFSLPVIALAGSRSVPDDKDGSYPLYADRPFPRQAADLIFIPFYAWGNRGLNDMRVWVREMK